MPPPSDPTAAEFMHRALALAMKGRGLVEPNPMVGCVIVRNGRVISEGYHQRYGGPHAEPNALAACTESPAGATAYVTLEPCCHTDKQTPPCVPRLIEARLARVFIGTLDPNPQVAGRGAAQLEAAGVHVDRLDLPEARQLIAPFIARMTYHRPYVTLKWAQTADRKVAGPLGRRVQISNSQSTQVIHQFRSRCDAILVGSNTVLCDDPMLTVRRAEAHRPLTRIVLDSRLRIPLDCRLVKTAREGKVIVYTTHDAAASNRHALESAGVEIRVATEESSGHISLPEVLHDLGSRSVTHLLVEAGPTLAHSFMAGDGLWDRLWVITSPVCMNDSTAPGAVALPAQPVAETMLGSDRLSEYLNPASSVTFHQEPSADFLLAR
jgi:diaminohydroxyphosphoribosylaminopyrimidine deaminase/5-amino-6-(5-phosphoribosylamino)uracil reductase